MCYVLQLLWNFICNVRVLLEATLAIFRIIHYPFRIVMVYNFVKITMIHIQISNRKWNFITTSMDNSLNQENQRMHNDKVNLTEWLWKENWLWNMHESKVQWFSILIANIVFQYANISTINIECSMNHWTTHNWNHQWFKTGVCYYNCN